MLAMLWSLLFGAFHVDDAGNLIAQGVDPVSATADGFFVEAVEGLTAVINGTIDRQASDATQPDRGCGSHCDQHSRGVSPAAASTHTALYSRIRHPLPGAHGLKPAPCDALYDPPRGSLAA